MYIYKKNTLLKAVFHLLPIHLTSKSFLLCLRCRIVISFVSRIIFVTKIAKPEICHYGIYIMDFSINYQVSFCVVDCTGFPLNCCRYLAAITTCTPQYVFQSVYQIGGFLNTPSVCFVSFIFFQTDQFFINIFWFAEIILFLKEIVFSI